MQVFFSIDLKKNIRYRFAMDRRPLSTKIENTLQKEIKKLAIDLEMPLNEVLEEAIRNFLRKHGKEIPKD